MSGYDLLSLASCKYANKENTKCLLCMRKSERKRTSTKNSLKKGSTKSALMTFNSHNTVEDNDARALK